MAPVGSLFSDTPLPAVAVDAPLLLVGAAAAAGAGDAAAAGEVDAAGDFALLLDADVAVVAVLFTPP